MRTAYLYLRISTDEQAASGLGLEAQEKACRAEAKKCGIEDGRLMIEGSIVDGKFTGLSGSTEIEKRFALPVILKQIRKGDVLIVSHRSRLARDPFIMQTVERALEKKGAKLISAAGEGSGSDDPSAVLMRGVTDVVNQHERGIGRQRTRLALRAQRESGKRSAGKVPYGMKLKADGEHVLLPSKKLKCEGRECSGCRNLEPEPLESQVIERVKQLARTMSTRSIAKWLDDNGIKKRNGKPWLHPQISRMIKKPVA